MGHFIEEILREAIYTEKKSCDLCHLAASMVTDRRTKKIFAELADEEYEHARSFFVIYTGSEFASTEILKKHARSEEPVFRELLKVMDMELKDQRALEIALSEEEECIRRYALLVAKIREPKYRQVFDEALKRSRMQYEIIKEEYQRVLAQGKGRSVEALRSTVPPRFDVF